MGYWIRSQLSGRPFLVERDDLRTMRDCIYEILSTTHVDCIHADQLTMAQFALINFSDNHPPIRVFDAHNAVWTIMERMAKNVPWFMRPILKIEARRVKRYEGGIVQSFDHTLAVTEIDRQYLGEALESSYERKAGRKGHPARRKTLNSITVTPIAVDTERLQPVSRDPHSKNLFTMGTLYYPPNADGIRWFAQDVFPMVKREEPKATLTIAGRNPPADFQRIAQESGGAIAVPGYIPDLRPHLEKAALMVVPLRAGSGMRVRILEAFAQAMPVVTTSVGLEGIDAITGEEALVADTPQEFAAAVVSLLRDQALQARLALNGRRLAECCYDWKIVLQRMDKVYGTGRP
jgi:glycosyltransferase involved in cell wall biosynthesis